MQGYKPLHGDTSKLRETPQGSRYQTVQETETVATANHCGYGKNPRLIGQSAAKHLRPINGKDTVKV